MEKIELKIATLRKLWLRVDEKKNPKIYQAIFELLIDLERERIGEIRTTDA